MTTAPNIFSALDDYAAFPRLSGLAMSADGSRLVTCVATPTAKGTSYASALWEIDPAGDRPAHRLTRSAKGESGAAFGVTGDLYFVSARPEPGVEDERSDAALWRLPAAGGDATVVVSRAGGVGSVCCAKGADVTVVGAGMLPGAADEPAHEELVTAREDAGVTAILHDSYPVRFWDKDLGPAMPQLHVLEPDPGATGVPAPVLGDAPARRLRAVTDGRGVAADDADVSPDGTFALVTVLVAEAGGAQRETVVRVDLASGRREVLLDEPGVDYWGAVIAPDQRRAVVLSSAHTTPERAWHPRLLLLDLADRSVRVLAEEWDRWPSTVCWLPDGEAILVTADDNGRAPVFRIGLDGAVEKVTSDDAAYTDVLAAPDGRTAYALRSSYLFPPEPVRIDLATGAVTALPAPAPRPEIPGRLEDVAVMRPDGVRVRSWLALPPAEDQPEGGFPMLLWIHGGPLGSWNAWTWRWNPWLLVAQGYAVLLPDPALSTGYGQEFVQRGWGEWGRAPYEDLMAACDAVVSRPDIDASRTAAMGGSFGGYMANWVAGQTDRFRALVSHASLWALGQFKLTTDAAFYWQRVMSPEMAEANSPHRNVGRIVTPMLVIHGDKDYRSPMGESLRLWYELLSASGSPMGEDATTPHRFLYFPDENHWILKPQHAKVWYGVVFSFLAEHVLGVEPPPPPPELGL